MKKSDKQKYIFSIIVISVLFISLPLRHCGKEKADDYTSLPVINYEEEQEKIDLLMLVNQKNPIDEDFKLELVNYKGHPIHRVLVEDLNEMVLAAKKDGVILEINTSYRDSKYQQELFDEEVEEQMKQGLSKNAAEQEALKTVSKPGFSEHETGLAIDFSESGNYIKNKIMWDWLASNAHKYGFIERYPKTKQQITKISYEPWHYRYVGKINSVDIYASGLSLEEYVNLNTVDGVK